MLSFYTFKRMDEPDQLPGKLRYVIG